MRSLIQGRRTVSLGWGLMMAALLTTPALALNAGHSDRSSSSSTTVGQPSPNSVATRSLAAVVVRKPDGRIRLGPHGSAYGETARQGPLVGNNVYNTTGARQLVSVDNRGTGEVLGAYYTFDISIQNDGTRSDRFAVKSTGVAGTAWTVTYFRGTTNITSAVVLGTYKTASIAPGGTYLIRARITLNRGGNVARLVTIRSVGTPAKVDAVKFAY